MSFPAVNKAEHSVPLDIDVLTQDAPCGDSGSPIDDFMRYTQFLVSITRRRDVYENSELLKYLTLSTVSAVEYYIRSVLAHCITICPESRRCAAGQQLALGSADYYETAQFGFAILENGVLSSAQEIKKQTKKMLGIDVKQGSSLEGALANFDNVCQIRHAIVHSRGKLSGKNVRDLALECSTQKEVFIDIWKFQSAVAAANNVVRSYNRTVFECLLQRWVDKAILRGDWSDDRTIFSGLFQLFYSNEDLRKPKRAYDAYRPVKRLCRARFGR
jgi:hypothetical protein